MKEYEIWCEGYAATGESGEAHFIGKSFGEDFLDAVEKFRHPENIFDYRGRHVIIAKGAKLTLDNNGIPRERYISCPISDEHPLGRKLHKYHAIWACELFDNEKDARKSFG